MPTAQFVSIATLSLVVFWAVGAYNRLVRLKNSIANAFGKIDVELKRRYEAVPTLVDAAKNHLGQETETLGAVIAARNQAKNASDSARSRPANALAVTALADAEQALSSSLNQLFALSDAYPELKADQAIHALSEELTIAEHKIIFARQAFNDAVLDYNRAQGQFPAALVAKLFSFAPAAMMSATQNAHVRKADQLQL